MALLLLVIWWNAIGILTKANECLLIPSGSVLIVNDRNYTIGDTVCNFCSITDKNGQQSSNLYLCETTSMTAQYISYEGVACNGYPVERYDIALNGNFYHDACIGYNDVMYKYEDGKACAGEIMSNSTMYGPWSPLDKCFQANSVDVVIESCQNGNPIAQIWHPPDLNCSGTPEAVITYNDCTPPYDGHTEQLSLIVNPCVP